MLFKVHCPAVSMCKLPHNNYAEVSGTDPKYNSTLEHEHYLPYSMQHLPCVEVRFRGSSCVFSSSVRSSEIVNVCLSS